MSGLIEAMTNVVSSMAAVPKRPKFSKISDEDRAYIRREYAHGTHIDVIAKHVGRSTGVIRQFIYHRAKDLHGRNPARTRVIRQYGESALNAAATPEEAIKKLADAKRIVYAAAIQSAKAARRRRYDYAMTEMRRALASGQDRNAAIFNCRAEGVSLEEIASEFGITRERIRQICNLHAGEVALTTVLSTSAPVSA